MARLASDGGSIARGLAFRATRPHVERQWQASRRRSGDRLRGTARERSRAFGPAMRGRGDRVDRRDHRYASAKHRMTGRPANHSTDVSRSSTVAVQCGFRETRCPCILAVAGLALLQQARIATAANPGRSGNRLLSPPSRTGWPGGQLLAAARAVSTPKTESQRGARESPQDLPAMPAAVAWGSPESARCHRTSCSSFIRPLPFFRCSLAAISSGTSARISATPCATFLMIIPSSSMRKATGIAKMPNSLDKSPAILDRHRELEAVAGPLCVGFPRRLPASP